MSSVRKYSIIRYFGYTVELLVIFVLQETPGLIPEVFGVRPILLIPAVISVAMFENEIPAMAFGLLSGILMDFGFGSVLGFHGLLLAVICYIISLIAANLFQTNFLTAVLFIVVSGAVFTLLQWVSFYVLYGYQYPVYALTTHYIPTFLYTIILTPVAYYFNRALALQIRSKEE